MPSAFNTVDYGVEINENEYLRRWITNATAFAMLKINQRPVCMYNGRKQYRYASGSGKHANFVHVFKRGNKKHATYDLSQHLASLAVVVKINKL